MNYTSEHLHFPEIFHYLSCTLLLVSEFRVVAMSSEKRKADAMVATQLYTAKSGTSLSLKLSENFDSRNLSLMEVPKEISALIEKGNELYLKGGSDTDVVLCTTNKTYTMKMVETSNQLFLVPPSNGNYLLECSLNDYYELKPTAPRVQLIKEILKNSTYTGLEMNITEDIDLVDNNNTNTNENSEKEVKEERTTKLGFVSRQELEEVVQASRDEIDEALRSIGVVEVNGKMRVLDKKLVKSVARELLDTIMIQGWNMLAINEEDCIREMPDTDNIYLKYVLSKLGTLDIVSDDLNMECEDQETKIWALDEDAVAKVTAHILFMNRKTSERGWPTQDFHLEWSTRNPDMHQSKQGVFSQPDPALLNGIAIKTIDMRLNQDVYFYLPADEHNIEYSTSKERFVRLFEIKNKFKQQELEPYCSDLYGQIGQPKSLADLLLRELKLVDGFYMMKT